MMLNKILKAVFAVFCIVTLLYLALPNFSFPNPPPDALQSKELADTETPLRRAYFTNYTREQVLDWYKKEFERSNFLGIKLPTYLLNYPPEDAQTIIRDQTRSTFLQEVVHPFRESVYINGFKPVQANDAIFIEGKSWVQKITVRFVPSSIFIRIGIFIATSVLMVILYNTWFKDLTDKKHE
jgi:hypothetical protein